MEDGTSERSRKSFREKHNLGDANILGFSGRISRQKGMLELMMTFLKSEVVGTLVLLGPIHSHSFWQFDESDDTSFAQEFGRLLSVGEGRIKWIEEVDHKEMPAFYSAIDTYISMSYFHDEDFNLTLSEALAAKRPAIVTAWGGYF